jgi:hypothetical protein
MDRVLERGEALEFFRDVATNAKEECIEAQKQVIAAQERVINEEQQIIDEDDRKMREMMQFIEQLGAALRAARAALKELP